MSANRRPPRRAGIPGEKRWKRIEGPWAPRRLELLESPAWRALSLPAHRVIDRLDIELRHHAGRENGNLLVTFNQFQWYGSLRRHAVASAIREAEALGFVEVTQRGRGGNAEFRKAHRFRLTFQPTDYGPPTDEWRRIGSVEDAKRIARTARRGKHKPVTDFAFSSGENVTENRESPGDENVTNSSDENVTTIDISTPKSPRAQRAPAPKARKPKNQKKGGAGGIPPLTTDLNQALGPRYYPPTGGQRSAKPGRSRAGRIKPSGFHRLSDLPE